MIFVICGKKRSGKDTVAEMLKETGKYDTYAFADHLKMVLEQAGLESGVSVFMNLYEDRAFWEGDREKPLLASNAEVKQLFESAIAYMVRKGYIDNHSMHMYDNSNMGYKIYKNTEFWTIRRLMQVFGTDIVCNLIGDDVWVKLTINDILSNPENHHEHVLITDCRQPHEYKYMKRLGAKFIFLERNTGIEDSHSTEKGLIPSEDDIIIDNNGTLDQLKSNIFNLIKSV